MTRAIRPHVSHIPRWRAGAAAATTVALCGGLLGGLQAGQASAATLASHASHAAGTGWLPSTPASWPQVVDESATPSQTITAGVTENAQTLDTVAGRQSTQILSVDLSNPNVRVGAVEAGDKVIDPADETVTSMGDRTGAVAGVNGGYFDINATGQPTGGSVVNGQILKSPPANFNAELDVLPDGTMTIGPENFSGTITDGPDGQPLASVNIPGDAASGKITEITPALASSAQSLSAPATLVTGQTSGNGQTLTVTGVQTGVTSLPVPAAGTEDLLGGGAGGQWLSSTVSTGDTLTVSSALTPNPGLTQLITGATVLVKNGQAYNDPTGQPPSGTNPETAVGLSRDGKHAIFVTIDGRLGESAAVGVTPAQATGYLLAHGAYSAVLFDGGGSTTMTARVPGTSGLSILNTPSDGSERPVANGLFVYSTATAPGAPVKVVADGGRPVVTVPGATIPVAAYATDKNANPATGTVQVSVDPPSLGRWADGKFTASRAGTGRLVARDGRVTGSEPIDVVSRLASVTVSPAQPDLGNGATQQLTLSGVTPAGAQVQVPSAAASWSVANQALGSVSAAGLFTAASSGDGVTNVTATVGGASASASVAVGSTPSVLDDMSDASNWSLNLLGGATATKTTAPGDVPPGDTASASMQLSYDFPAGTGVKQVVFSPNGTINVPVSSSGQDPTGVGLWIKGDGAGPELAESYIDVSGTTTTLYPTTITWQGWQLVVAELPAGLNYPLSVSFLDLLTISNPAEIKGTVDVADLEALYSPRPVTTPPYVAIPKNPSWLRFEESAGDFSPGGSTILTGGNTGLAASDPGSAGASAITAIGQRLPSLPAQARPSLVQATGGMTTDGAVPDLTSARSALSGLAATAHDAVGPGETGQGAQEENGNFSQVFGNTHYAYTDGGANVIVTDSSHGGLLASDPYQAPSEPQYPWLVQQLSGNRSPLVIVASNDPAYDPHPRGTDEFTDRWEAQMYVELVQRYQQTHPGMHVVMLAGGAGGFAEQILDPQGQPSSPSGGIPQLTVADLGTPAGAPPGEGGFYHFALLHVTGGGLQFTVEPVLASVSVAAPQPLGTGRSETMTATGSTVGGDNYPAITMPVADPASHVWASSSTRVATVNPVTGVVTAHHPGQVSISVTCGGITASHALTVTG
ncbi:MAG TPA: phosphodiester glycosidase family protein [Streptosporangiaceae bacterium]